MSRLVNKGFLISCCYYEASIGQALLLYVPSAPFLRQLFVDTFVVVAFAMQGLSHILDHATLDLYIVLSFRSPIRVENLLSMLAAAQLTILGVPRLYVQHT